MSTIKKLGNREEVWNGTALYTSGRLSKDDLFMADDGKIKSKRRSEMSKGNTFSLKLKTVDEEEKKEKKGKKGKKEEKKRKHKPKRGRNKKRASYSSDSSSDSSSSDSDSD